MYAGTDEPYLFGRLRVSGADPEHRSYRSFASFSDPDGNGWLLQEITARLPGRVEGDTTFTSSNDLASALRRAAAAHGEHEKRIGKPDADWSDWYAEYIVREGRPGKDLRRRRAKPRSTDRCARRKCGGVRMRSDMIPGAVFPDYELSDHTAKRRKLSELQGPDPMVLVLSRGSFCPKDRRQAEGLVELHREMEVGYCRLVTISSDNITETNENRSGIGAHWPFLSDARRTIQKDLDIAEYTDSLHNPMIPHVIVLEPGLVIYKIYNGYWFFGRPTMEDLRQDLRTVTRKCRPDWDITTPELRAAWQQGNKELFYPYGKTFVQTLGEQD